MAEEIKIEKEEDKKYPRESAGAEMTTRIPIIEEHETIRDAQKLIVDAIRTFDTVSYVYIVDEERKLKNVISVKELYRHEPTTVLNTVKKVPTLFATTPETDRERPVYLAIRHNVKAIPVTDKDDVLLGVVPNDTILDILYREEREDLLQLAGIHRGAMLEDPLTVSPLTAYRHRVPWLLLGILGSIGAAHIITLFRGTLELNIVLASFIPLVAYISNAVAAQAQVLFIRDLATHHKVPLGRYAGKQLITGFLVALTAGATLFAAAYLGLAPTRIAFTVSVAIIFSILFSISVALIVPYFLSRLKQDPAIGSGPFATSIQDIASVTIYLSVATWFLG